MKKLIMMLSGFLLGMGISLYLQGKDYVTAGGLLMVSASILYIYLLYLYFKQKG